MKTMNRILNKIASLVLSSCLFIFSCAKDNATNPPVQPEIGVAGDGNLAANLEYIRSQNNLPALAGMTMRGGVIVEMAAVGLRAISHPEEVTVNDRWHLGSITKSMTATLAAVLVEKGIISWETTVAEVFPDLVATMRPEYKDIRLDALLSHSGGLQRDISDLLPYVSDTSPLTDQRRKATADILTESPGAERGTFLYSNVGYVVAGAMLETVTGEPWETLMQTYVFAPLGMSATDFGAPGAAGQRDQPWGHVPSEFLNIWVALDPGDKDADLPAVYGPAGLVHSTMHDMALYLAAHLAGAQGIGGLVTKESFAKLHTPAPGTQYALGWVVMDDQLWHDGSNARWFALIGFKPGTDAAIMAVTNVAGSGAEQAIYQDVPNLLEARFDAAFGGTSQKPISNLFRNYN